MNETVNATEVDKHTVVGDVLNRTFEHLTLLERADDLLLLSFEFSFDECLVANHNVLVLLVDLNHLEVEGLTNVYIIVADGLNVDLRTGKEGFDAEYVDDHTTLRAALDVTLDDFLVLESLVDAFPRLACASLLVREDELTLLVLEVFYVHLYLVTDLEFGIVAEFVGGNNTIALRADAYHNFALRDVGDFTFYHFVFVHVVERLFVSRFSSLVVFAGGNSAVFKCIPIEICERSNVFEILH